MKFFQKQTVCNSSNNEKIKPWNKIEEIKQRIKRLKTKKYPGIDCISSYKWSNKTILSYPGLWLLPRNMESWTCSFNTQNSSNNNPSNYRRIILLNSLGKLLSSLVYNRIENEIESKDILSPNQAGFMKNYRTSDQIFTLSSLITKAISKGNYLYTCFIDFRKA